MAEWNAKKKVLWSRDYHANRNERMKERIRNVNIRNSQYYELRATSICMRLLRISYIQRNPPRSPHTCFILHFYFIFRFIYPNMLRFVQGQIWRLYWCIGTYVLNVLLLLLWIELYSNQNKLNYILYNERMYPREHRIPASMLVRWFKWINFKRQTFWYIMDERVLYIVCWYTYKAWLKRTRV